MIAPGSMHKLGKGGSLASRQAILHSLVHIESWAVDLSWDVIARFGSNPSYALPDEFISDFIQVQSALHKITFRFLANCMPFALTYVSSLCLAHGNCYF